MASIEEILKIEDPVRRRAFFIALLSKEIIGRGGMPPIVVGGEAVEIYTQGSYTTGDIDIKSPKSLTEEILKEWHFTKTERCWVNKKLDIFIDWLGESLDEGEEAEKRVNTIEIAEGLEIKVISIEDLVIDRLTAAKWWKDTDSLMWAKVLLKVKEELGKVDLDYLQKKAKEQKIVDFLAEATSVLSSSKGRR